MTEQPLPGPGAPSPAAEGPVAGRGLKIFKPLSHRQFALLWTGLAVSLFGDGVYLVALAWQVYDLSNSPAALSLVGVAWTLPMVVFSLVGGVLSDRIDRRRVLLTADVVRALAVSVMGVLSLAGALELWHMYVLAAVYGTGDALFGPAFSAIVPDVVPVDALVQANSLVEFVRPFAFRLFGPAVGGLLIAGVGVGTAFLLDALTFLVSIAALLLMNPLARGVSERRSVRRELGEGFAFVRAHVWLWGTLLAAAVVLLFFWGPQQVLVPFLVRNDMRGGADTPGLIYAAGGVGSIIAALILAQKGLPRLHITMMYAAWTVAIGAIIGYAFVDSPWQAMIVAFVASGSGTIGNVFWFTLMQRNVPSDLLGRVSSFDWLISIALVPASFALTGPIAEAIGARQTLFGAGAIGALLTVAFLFLPGMREGERRPVPGQLTGESSAATRGH